jgi:3-oxoacyl-(acyl-carrier-protein) synthase
MIRAAGWFNLENYGIVGPSGKSWRKTSPDVEQSSDILALVERPVKYLSRMTVETRCCLCAAALAMKAADWNGGEIGLISSSAEGVVKANEEYFRDYVATGRTLGRGNLFIYTLATSALGEVAIALSLTGPAMFVQHDVDPLAASIADAEQIVADGEAKGMLVIWSDANSAICYAIASGAGGIELGDIQSAIR